MLYKFQSPASGDVIMLGPQGDQMLRLLGRDPSAEGIIEPDAMPRAIEALEAAAQASRARDVKGDAPAGGGGDNVGLHRRLWPVIELLRRAHATGKPVVWGV